jgi:hypothetical protein
MNPEFTMADNIEHHQSTSTEVEHPCAHPTYPPAGTSAEPDIIPSVIEVENNADEDPAHSQDEEFPTSKDEKLHVQVNQVSRQSTETGDSKISKRRFVIKWPSTSDVLGPQIHWYTPTMMILLGVAGLLGAVGHHLYNSRLQGRPVIGDAQWPQRWGVAMAFFVKMTLVGAVQMAVKQRAWVSTIMYGGKLEISS